MVMSSFARKLFPAQPRGGDDQLRAARLVGFVAELDAEHLRYFARLVAHQKVCAPAAAPAPAPAPAAAPAPAPAHQRQ